MLYIEKQGIYYIARFKHEDKNEGVPWEMNKPMSFEDLFQFLVTEKQLNKIDVADAFLDCDWSLGPKFGMPSSQKDFEQYLEDLKKTTKKW